MLTLIAVFFIVAVFVMFAAQFVINNLLSFITHFGLLFFIFVVFVVIVNYSCLNIVTFCLVVIIICLSNITVPFDFIIIVVVVFSLHDIFFSFFGIFSIFATFPFSFCCLLVLFIAGIDGIVACFCLLKFLRTSPRWGLHCLRHCQFHTPKCLDDCFVRMKTKSFFFKFSYALLKFLYVPIQIIHTFLLTTKYLGYYTVTKIRFFEI